MNYPVHKRKRSEFASLYASNWASLKTAVFLSLMLPSVFISQTHKIDSLLGVLDNGNVNVIEAIDTLLAIGNERKLIHTELIYEYDLRIAAAAQSIGYHRGHARALLGIAQYHLLKAAYDSAFAYIVKARTIAVKHHDAPLLAKIGNTLGVAYFRTGDNDRALEHYVEAIKYSKAAGDELHTAHVHKNIGSVYYIKGMHDEAITHYETALHAYENLNNDAGAADVLMSIANITTDVNRALDYYSRCMAFYEKHGDNSGIAHTALNMGHRLKEANRIHEAMTLLRRGLKTAETLSDKYSLTGLCVSYGNLCATLGDFQEAWKYLNRALDLSENRDDKYWKINALFGLASLAERNNTELALSYYEQALEIAEKIGSREFMLHAYKCLSNIHSCRKEYPNAYAYMALWGKLKDSLHNEATLRTITGFNAKYDAEKREAQIRRLEQEKTLQALIQARQSEQLARQTLQAARNRQKMELLAREKEILVLDAARISADLSAQHALTLQKQNETLLLKKDVELKSSIASREKGMRNSLLLGLLLVVAIGFLGVKRVQAKRTEASLRAEAAELRARAAEANALAALAESERRQKDAQKEFSRALIGMQESERKRIAAELHDSLGQDLLVIKNRLLFALQRGGMNTELAGQLAELSSMTSTALNEVRQISRDLRPYQLDRFGLTSSLTARAKKLAESTEIAFSYDIGNVDGVVLPENEIHVFRIVQECVTNVLRHAQASETRLQVIRENGVLRMRVTDNGCGFEASDIFGQSGPGAGFGLHSIRERVEILGGKLQIDSSPDNGTCVDIRIPACEADEHE